MKLTLNTIVLGLVLSLSACKKAPEKVAASATPVAAPAVAAPPVAAANPAATATLMAELDWNTLPESTADIGGYPYFKAPETMRIDANEANTCWALVRCSTLIN